jgi:hypothetical protein
VSDAAAAIERRQIHQEELERKAGELFGHEDYITSEMERVKRLGRFLSPRALLSVVEGYLDMYHRGLKLSDEEPKIYAVRLTEGLRRALQAASPPENPWLDRSMDEFLHFTTDGDLAFRKGGPELELLNANHPLIRAAVRDLKRALDDPNARVGHANLTLGSKHVSTFNPGVYALVVFVLEVTGMRPRRLMEPVGLDTESGAILDAETAEYLLHLVLDKGDEWDDAQDPPRIDEEQWRVIDGVARDRFRSLREMEATENRARHLRRSSTIEAEYDRIRESIRQKMRTARSRGRGGQILALFQSQLDRAGARFDLDTQQLEKARESRVSLEPALAACVVSVRHENR